jgi:hypothetical protein
MDFVTIGLSVPGTSVTPIKLEEKQDEPWSNVERQSHTYRSFDARPKIFTASSVLGPLMVRGEGTKQTHSTVTTFSPLLQPILRTSLTQATRFTALLEPRNKPSRWTKKRAILTASASVILVPDVTRRQLLPCVIRRGIRGNFVPESIVDHGERELNVLCEAIDTDALNDSINLVSPPGTLALLLVVHDAVLYLRVFLFMITTVAKRRQQLEATLL